MKQIQINGHIIAELPADADEVKIIHNGTRLAWFKPKYHRETLPSGHTYTLLGKVPELTEEQAAGMVEWDSTEAETQKRFVLQKVGESRLPTPKYKKDYRDYGIDKSVKYPYLLDTTIESLHSLLRSKGMNPETCIVIKEN